VKNVWFASAGFLFYGCMSVGPLYEDPPPPPDGYAQIVIFRVSAVTGGAHSNRFTIDNTHIADLHHNGYTHFLVRPGAHVLNGLKIDAAAGSTYYFRYMVRPGLPKPGGTFPVLFLVLNDPAISQVSYEEAKQDITDRRFEAPTVERLE